MGLHSNFFDKHLGKEQYYPFGAEALPENRLFAQYHAPQTTAMKDQILKELASPASKVRIIFATMAMGIGVDIPLRCVIHVGPPCKIREYFQDTGRAGRDGKPAIAVLHYNNHAIAKNREGISDDIRTFCQLETACLRKFLLNCLDANVPETKVAGHFCCTFRKSNCDCLDCLKNI